MTKYTVDPTDPERILLTNGRSVVLTTDGGCSWITSYEIPGDSEAQIVDLSAGSGQVVMVLADYTSVRPRVLVSGYGGESWREVEDGLEASPGQPIAAAFTRSNPKYAHLLMSAQVGVKGTAISTGYKILQSASAGQSWEDRGGNEVDPGIEIGGANQSTDELTHLVPDPEDAGRSYLYGPEGMYSYTGALLSKLVDGEITALGVVRAPGAAATTLLVTVAGSKLLSISTDGGTNFTQVGTPVVAQSFAEGMKPGDYFLAGSSRVLYMKSGKSSDISPKGRAVTDLSMARTDEAISLFKGVETVTLYGRTGTTLERTTETRMYDLPGAVQSILVDGIPALDDTLLPGMLTPPFAKLRMTEGHQKTVPYVFRLPESRTPLDVVFDVDVSSSMQEEIDGIRASMADIASELALSGVDAWFGVAQYRSFTNPPAFERIHDLAPPDDGLAEALNKLISNGGGDETQLESLRQIATGAGSDVGAGIAPDQDANWRKGSLRVIINVTDERISEGKNHPSYDEVAQALLEDKAMHFGIAVQDITGGEGLGSPKAGLMRISRESNSLAPSSGVDCNGDGTLDLYEGEPLVCIVDPLLTPLDASVMGNAIINVLKAVSDIGDLHISATNIGPTKTRIEPAIPSAATVPGIDFKKPNEVKFSITYRCPSLTKTTRFPIEVEVIRAAGALGRARALLTCDAKPEPKPPAAPVAPLLLPLAAVIPPPPPRPPEVISNPEPNPQPNPAQQPQAQAQGSLAAEEQRQPQLAYAEASGVEGRAAKETVGKPPSDETYFLSAVGSRGPDLTYVAFLGVAFAVVGAAGRFALARQQARRYQWAYAKKSRY